MVNLNKDSTANFFAFNDMAVDSMAIPTLPVAILSNQLKKTGKIVNVDMNVQQLKTGVYTANITNGINAVSKKYIKK